MRDAGPEYPAGVPTLRYVIVDVFTDTALAGNQLAVFTDAREIDADLMQALAKEMNFSETTFLLPAEQGGTARVRIFNPSEEMRFAGHPVLGSAWVLAQPLQRAVIELETGMGITPVEIERDESGCTRVRAHGAADSDDQHSRRPGGPALRARSRRVGAPDRAATTTVRRTSSSTLASDEAVAALSPEISAIARFGVTGVNCIAGSGASWKSRMFWLTGRGRSDRVGRGADRLSPLPARARRVGRVDRDLAGRRDRATVDALRARRRW